jgi:hypothetical protein
LYIAALQGSVTADILTKNPEQGGITAEKQGPGPLIVAGSSRSSSESEEFLQPTEEERSTLRKVPGNIPKVAYTLCVVEFGKYI